MTCPHRPLAFLGVYVLALGTALLGASNRASAAPRNSDDSTIVTLAADDVARDDGPTPAAVTSPGKPSAEFSLATQQFNNRQWADAAVGWHKVVEGVTGDDAANRQLAEYHLAISLYRLQLYQVSFEHFAVIAKNRQHLRFAETLPWLSQLIERLPEPARVSAELLHFKDTEIAEANLPGGANARASLWYWRGREFYQNRDLYAALANLRKVTPGNAHFVEAQFFIAATSVLKRESLPAIVALRRVLSALDEHRTTTAQPERMRNLAYLALARIVYSSSMHLDPETNIPRIDADHLNVGLALWRKIAPESEYWLEAQHEMAWAYFMAGDYARALGTVHTIESPYFEEAEFPEMSILKSVIYYANCNYEAAMVVVARFQARIAPMRTEMGRLLTLYKKRNAEEFYSWLLDLKSQQVSLNPETQAIASRVYRDRSFVRRLEHVSLLDRERQGLDRLPHSLQSSALGKELQSELSASRKRAIVAVVERAIAQYEQFLEQVHEQQRNGEKVLFPPYRFERNLIFLDKAATSDKLSKVTPSHGLFRASSLAARSDGLAPSRDKSDRAVSCRIDRCPRHNAGTRCPPRRDLQESRPMVITSRGHSMANIGGTSSARISRRLGPLVVGKCVGPRNRTLQTRNGTRACQRLTSRARGINQRS